MEKPGKCEFQRMYGEDAENADVFVCVWGGEGGDFTSDSI